MRRILPQVLIVLAVMVIGGSAQAGLFEVSCEASLTNSSPYTLKVTGFSAHHTGWSTTIRVGQELKPTETLRASISNAPMKCGATVWFTTSAGGSFKATFH